MRHVAIRQAGLSAACIAASVIYAAPGSALPHPAVTAVLDFERPYASTTLDAMSQELNRILAPTGVDVALQIRGATAETTTSEKLVFFKMRGACTMDPLPVGALSDERGALAMTYSVDGQILSFGEVECDGVRTALRRALGAGKSPSQQQIYDKALARVLMHELYHIFVQSTAHTKQGLTKERLSGWELSRDSLPLSRPAAEAFSNAFSANFRKTSGH